MTGLPPSSPLDTIWFPLKCAFVTVPLPAERIHELVSSWNSELGKMHRHVLSVKIAAQERANRRRPAPIANFTVGDFVLYSSHAHAKKLSLRWRGPARVIKCPSEHIYLIENLITLERFESHAQRLRFIAILL
jgi:hypothetical protein